MKKINFIDFGSNVYFIVLIIFITTIITNFLILFEIIEIDNEKIERLITFFSSLLTCILIFKFYWFKNYFRWNKTSFMARINSSEEMKRKFNEIKEIRLIENKIQITELDENIDYINLENIDESSKRRLLEILNLKTN